MLLEFFFYIIQPAVKHRHIYSMFKISIWYLFYDFIYIIMLAFKCIKYIICIIIFFSYMSDYFNILLHFIKAVITLFYKQYNILLLFIIIYNISQFLWHIILKACYKAAYIPDISTYTSLLILDIILIYLLDDSFIFIQSVIYCWQCIYYIRIKTNIVCIKPFFYK